MRLVNGICILIATIFIISEAKTPVTDKDVIAYLKRFGYVTDDSTDSRLKQHMANGEKDDAIKSFQNMFHIPETGVVDDATKDAILLPRCGVKDNIVVKGRRQRRYIAASWAKWQRTDLTYTITRFTNDMSRANQEAVFARAFKMWSDVSPLTFTYKPDSSRYQVDIEMYFAYYSHGDYDAFDGPGNILAHAFYPANGGDAHFDDSEYFTKDSYSGVNLLQVAAHEIGHVLALSHSNVRSALMAPYYRNYNPNLQLDQDDIDGVQYLYGVNQGSNPAEVPETSPTDEHCQDGQFDALTYIDHGNLFGFRGDQVFELNAYGVESGYPKLIRDVFSGLPSDLDAALYWPGAYGWVYTPSCWGCWRQKQGKTFFFKGSQVWVYMDYTFQYKRYISQEFPGLPNNIDSAFVWTRNGKTYFTKGYQYYRFQTNGGMDSGYPRSLSIWLDRSDPQVTSAINGFDSVVQWRGATYMFHGTNYYKYSDYELKFYSGYPKSIAQYWYGCGAGNMIMAEDGEDIKPNTGSVEGIRINEDGTPLLEEDGNTGNGTGSLLRFTFTVVLVCSLAAHLTISDVLF